MNLQAYSDFDLSALIDNATREARRRVRCAEPGCDVLSMIRGHEAAKRALTVAIAGNHSILFCGSPGVGKSMLIGAAYAMGLAAPAFESLPCPCGNYGSAYRGCVCTESEFQSHLRGLPVVDIFCSVSQVPEREMNAPAQWSTSSRDVLERIAGAGPDRPMKLDEHAETLLRHAATEIGLNGKQREAVIRIAHTIARLDNANGIEAAHLAEAVNYRTPAA